MKRIILTVCLAFFVSYGSSQEEDLDVYDDLFGELEDIACEDLPVAGENYATNRSDNQKNMEESLTEAIQILKDISKQKTVSSKKNISELINHFEEAVGLSQSIDLIFSNKTKGISNFLKNCVFYSDDISCKNLPKVFKKYDEDQNLNQTAMERALSEASQTLRDISNQESSIFKKDISKLADRLKEVTALSQTKALMFSNQADDISYFLKDCLKKEKE